MNDADNDYRKFFYPPGGILIWMIIFVELITFSLGLIAMVYYGKSEATLYHSSCLKLNKNIAIINTIVLLTSSYFIATAIQFVKNENTRKATDYIKLTDMMAGAAFWHMCDLIWLLLFPVLYLLF